MKEYKIFKQRFGSWHLIGHIHATSRQKAWQSVQRIHFPDALFDDDNIYSLNRWMMLRSQMGVYYRRKIQMVEMLEPVSKG